MAPDKQLEPPHSPSSSRFCLALGLTNATPLKQRG